MPGSKRPYKTANRSKRNFRSKSSRKKKVTNKQLAKRIRKLEEQPEWKYDDAVAQFNYADSSNNMIFNTVDQGDDYNQRIGEEIIAKRLDLNMQFHYGPTEGAPVPNDMTIRVILIWDNQFNGGVPGFNLEIPASLPTEADFNTALLDGTGGPPITIAPFNYRTRERYKVIMDKQFSIAPYTALIRRTKQFNMSFPLHNKVIKFSTSGGDPGSLPSKALFLQIVTTDGTSESLFNGHGRFWFIDP